MQVKMGLACGGREGTGLAALENVAKHLEERQAHRYNPEVPFKFIVLGPLLHFHWLIFQWDQDQRHPLLIVEWISSVTSSPKASQGHTS